MSNKITIEFCPEDRARIDRLTEALEAKVLQTQFQIEKEHDKPLDAVQETAKAALQKAEKATTEEAPKIAQDAPKASDHPTLDPFPEVPEAKAQASEAEEKEAEPTVTTAELQQLVIALCRAGKKDKVREVVNGYGVQTVAAIPEAKLSEAFKKLKALEG